ncbi:unnamed protein product [Periconia digitata]|uniref:Uncharacterized protein n=1 Tax=Periconia digitata TaxID=1303443 RepID=A0A9W4UF97_9PLEO|nr:unnamed protein product [Periconia digitata]
MCSREPSPSSPRAPVPGSSFRAAAMWHSSVASLSGTKLRSTRPEDAGSTAVTIPIIIVVVVVVFVSAINE